MMCCCGRIATGVSDVMFLAVGQKKWNGKNKEEAVQVNSIPLHSYLCLCQMERRVMRGVEQNANAVHTGR
jgi:hypothetical protein